MLRARPASSDSGHRATPSPLNRLERWPTFASALVNAITLMLVLLTLPSTTATATATATAAKDPELGPLKYTVAEMKEQPRRFFYVKKSNVLMYLEEHSGNLMRSDNDGASWKAASGIPSGAVGDVFLHPFDGEKTIYATNKAKDATHHWVSTDKGANWRKFSVPLPAVYGGLGGTGGGMLGPFAFNAERPNSVIYIGQECTEDGSWWSGAGKKKHCRNTAYYTLDSFKSAAKLLVKDVRKCLWALSSKDFTTATPEGIFCLKVLNPEKNKNTGEVIDNTRLEYSDKFFDAGSKELRHIDFEDSRSAHSDKPEIEGVVGLTSTEGFLIAVTKHKGTVNLGMFVSTDTKKWSEAHLDDKDGATLTETAFAVVQSSSPHSITVAVQFGDEIGESSSSSSSSGMNSASSNKPYGTLYRSNSNGTYFTPLLSGVHRANTGLVDYESVAGVHGIALANIVKNAEDFDGGHLPSKPQLQTVMTHGEDRGDGEGSFRYLRPPLSLPGGEKKYPCVAKKSTFEAELKSGKCALHLFSITQKSNIGRVYSSESAPGILMGVGNVGDRLHEFHDADTFLSADGGFTWSSVLPGPHMYEFVDSGAFIVAVPITQPGKDQPRNKHPIRYSFDYGQTWSLADVTLSDDADGDGKEGDEVVINPRALFSDADSTSRRAILLAQRKDDHTPLVISLDFSSVITRKCSSSDKEKWVARSVPHSEHGKDNSKVMGCLMGHTSIYWRKKANAQCYIGELFKHPSHENEDCPCTRGDYECDFNFVHDPKSGKCVLVDGVHEAIPDGACTKSGESFMGSSGYRIVPGNTCRTDKPGAVHMDKTVSKPCSRVLKPQPNKPSDSGGAPENRLTTFDAEIVGRAYFDKTQNSVVWTARGDAWLTKDEGMTFERILGEYPITNTGSKNNVHKIVSVIPHEFDPAYGFAMGSDGRLHVTEDSGVSWKEIQLRRPANTFGVPLIDVHPVNPHWLLFISNSQNGLYTEALFTRSLGRNDDWTVVDTFVERCTFGKRSIDDDVSKIGTESVYCLSYKDKTGEMSMETRRKVKSWDQLRLNPLQLNYIEKPGGDHKALLNHAMDIHPMDKFVAVAVLTPPSANDNNSNNEGLTVYISSDGITFKDAQFPPNVSIQHKMYTLMQSSSGVIMMGILDGSVTGLEYGQLYMSSSDGFRFRLALADVNMNTNGIIDFEKVPGLPGVMIANQVINKDQLGQKGVKKHVQTVISYDDGRWWEIIKAPSKDSNGNIIKCEGKDIADDDDDIACTLNLHGPASLELPERLSGSAFSSSSTPGFLIGVGSVSRHLMPYKNSHTFASRDGGRLWTQIHARTTAYELGDHGGLMVIVPDTSIVQSVKFSWNWGKTWHDAPLGGKMLVTSIDTVPDGSSLVFSISGQMHPDSDHDSGSAAEPAIVGLNFGNSRLPACEMSDDSSNSKGDYELFSPPVRPSAALRRGEKDESSKNKNCLFGEVVKYWRRKEDSVCVIGNKFELPPIESKQCECDETDYECAPGFYRHGENMFDPGQIGVCELYGLDPNRPDTCPVGTSYDSPSGYVKLPRSKCVNGLKRDMETVSRACPNEDDPPLPDKPGEDGKPIPPSTTGIHAFATSIHGKLVDYFYFPHSAHVLALMDNGRAYMSTNDGGDWTRVPPNENHQVIKISRHEYDDSRAFIYTSQRYHYMTEDDGATWKRFEFPADADPYNVKQGSFIAFHPTDSDQLLYHAAWDKKTCDLTLLPPGTKNCPAVVMHTKNNGKDWLPIRQGVRTCKFGQTNKFKPKNQNLILCEVYPKFESKTPLFGKQPARTNVDGVSLVSSIKQFKDKETVLEDDIGNFAFINEYLVVSKFAHTKSGIELKFSASTNGIDFSPAKFPKDVSNLSTDFTMIDNNSRSLMVFEPEKSSGVGKGGSRAPFGGLYRSDASGSLFNLVLPDVHTDSRGLIDYSIMNGEALDGIALANVVSNAEEIKLGTQTQPALRSLITHTNGASWADIPVPQDDKEAQAECAKIPSGSKCALHLHGVTSIGDEGDLFTSEGATGFMIAVGNVGEKLGHYKDADTYFTWNAGHSWRRVAKGPHLHGFGDHGGVMVLVRDDAEAVDHVMYSKDMGKSFHRFNLITSGGNDKKDDSTAPGEPGHGGNVKLGAGDKVKVLAVTMEPSGTGTKMMLIGYRAGSSPTNILFIHLDFSGIHSKTCADDTDFEDWSPARHPEEKCLFGERIVYRRRIAEKDCTIGRKFQRSRHKSSFCPCNEFDFECDYNFVRSVPSDPRSECVPLPGFEPNRWKDGQCKPGEDFFNVTSGYRRIARTQCFTDHSSSSRLSDPSTISCPARIKRLFIMSIIILPVVILIVLFIAVSVVKPRRGSLVDRITSHPLLKPVAPALKSAAFVCNIAAGVLIALIIRGWRKVAGMSPNVGRMMDPTNWLDANGGAPPSRQSRRAGGRTAGVDGYSQLPTDATRTSSTVYDYGDDEEDDEDYGIDRSSRYFSSQQHQNYQQHSSNGGNGGSGSSGRGNKGYSAVAVDPEDDDPLGDEFLDTAAAAAAVGFTYHPPPPPSQSLPSSQRNEEQLPSYSQLDDRGMDGGNDDDDDPLSGGWRR
ncbi:Oligoxyloglucan reducing end-specific cellobiohydrolase [Ramicandelaber brevisporus]|nr:Oligoxyloglucan reducing end-specific cellobiohydrolase [Ramicandelaber brevisporus]